MKKITLICAAGHSSSLLVTRMEQAAKTKGLNVVIRAISESRFDEYENDTDILLIAPQLEYLYEDIKEKYSSEKMSIRVIPGIDYGMINGTKVLDDVLKLINCK